MKNVITFLLVIFSFGFSVPADDVKLEYNFKVGDQYLWVQTTKQKIKQVLMGSEQNTETSFDGEFSLKVVELTANGARIETQFLKLKNTVKSFMGNMEMDSEGGDDKMENKIFKSMMNKPFYLTMNKRGVIENVEGVDNLWSGLKDLNIDETKSATIKQSLEQLLGKSSLKGSFEQAFVTYPENKIKAGDTWAASTGANATFPITADNTWSLVKIVNTTASLTADGQVKSNSQERPMLLPGGMKAKMDMNGQQAMKSNVDIKTGWPQSLDVLSELKGKMTLLAGGMIAEDMEIPMEILTESSFKISKK